jgi:hypothetical protein
LKRAARAARFAALLGAPQAHRGLPRTVFAATLVMFADERLRHRPARCADSDNKAAFREQRLCAANGR